MVDKETLVHKKYQNIVSLGDVAGIPTSKTSAAIRKQVPIAAKNLIAPWKVKSRPRNTTVMPLARSLRIMDTCCFVSLTTKRNPTFHSHSR